MVDKATDLTREHMLVAEDGRCYPIVDVRPDNGANGTVKMWDRENGRSMVKPFDVIDQAIDQGIMTVEMDDDELKQH